MSTIGSSDPHLNRAGLDRLDGQVSLEELRGRDQGTGARESTGLELRGTAPAADVRPSTDSGEDRSEEHTSELQSLMRISYAVFCLKKTTTVLTTIPTTSEFSPLD